jgi:hypothetical protein
MRIQIDDLFINIFYFKILAKVSSTMYLFD